MWTEGEYLIQESGLFDGKKVTTNSLCSPKNAGKSNATTGEEQALKELEAKYTKKLSEGYFKTIKEAENKVVILPMLAHEYEKHKKKVDWSNCYIQPKMDGQRALGSQINERVNGTRGAVFITPSYTITSRQGKDITTMDHILKDLGAVTGHLDGELYAHNHSFQENMKLIKKYRPGKTELVKWHLYDLVSDDSFSKRYDRLSTLYYALKDQGLADNLVLVETNKVESYEEAMEYHAKNIEAGYEGSILRWGVAGYKLNGRSDSLLKLKDFIDVTATLIDVIPEERRPTMGKALCELINDNGETIQFPASFKATHEERTEYLENKKDYIGQTLELRFFEWTDDGIPRHPVAHGFRNDK